jgi:type I restriction enzyme S subunit
VTVDKVELGAVAKVLNGYAFKSKEYVDDGIRIVRITNVQKGRIQDDDPKFIDNHRSDEFARFMLDDGDILISLTGNVGRVGVIETSMLPAALNQRVGALKIESENVEPEYLFHVLNSENFEQDAIKNSKGIAQLNLSSKWVEKYEIPLPPLAEQKRIAGILDAADALRAKRRESLAQLDNLLQSSNSQFKTPYETMRYTNPSQACDFGAEASLMRRLVIHCFLESYSFV